MGALKRWLDRRRADGFLAGVLIPVYVALSALAVALAVGCALWKGLAPGASGGCSLHAGAALSGSSEVFAREIAPGCGELDLGEARATIAADYALVAVYATLGTLLLWWLWPRAWRIAPLRRLRPLAFVPAAAGLFDAVENSIVLLGLSEGPSLREGYARAAAVAGWWKWMLAVGALLATVACICGAVGNRRTPQPPRPGSGRPGRPEVRDEIGICLSGGGIRAAGAALGALRAFDRRGLLLGARWIAAVSGGAYAASAWFVARGRASEARDVVPRPEGGVDGLLDHREEPDLFGYLAEHRRYLSTGRGGLPATFVTGGLLATFNVLVLTLLVCVIAWPVGRFAATWPIQPALRDLDYAGGQSLEIPARLWLPGLAGLAIAALWWLVSLFLWDPARRSVLRVAAFFGAGGVALLALLAGIPVAMAEAPRLWEELHPNPLWGAGIVTAAVALGLVAAAGWLVARPGAAAPRRAGAVLLGLLALLAGGRVATDAAYGEGWFAWSDRAYALVLASFCAFYFFANAQSWSLFRLHYLRLRSTFATTQRRARRAAGAPGRAGVYPLALEHEPEWPAYRGRTGPELLVCASARSGAHAEPFTLSPETPEAYLGRLREPRRWEPRLGSVSAAAAMSGAAFRPPRSALLAALNVRLGVWMPNPRYPSGAGPFKKPRLGYLLKEVFGLHDSDDPYVYVTDGAHWDGLGLVELVRRRPRWIFCVDSSRSLGAFEAAIALARTECGVEIDLDTGALSRGADGRLPQTAHKTGVVRYHSCGGAGPDGCPTGLLFYGRAMLAQDSPVGSLSFSLRDRPEPPAYGRFLPEDELLNLVRLGEWVGRGLALDYERFGPPP